MTASLTTQQVALLRRVGSGLGLPAYVLRPRNCVQDIELMCSLDLIATAPGQFWITPLGSDHLHMLDSGDTEVAVDRLRTAHGAAPARSVEHWPQEY